VRLYQPFFFVKGKTIKNLTSCHNRIILLINQKHTDTKGGKIMDINSLKGISAYATPPVDQTLAQNQNREASRTESAKENTADTQKAFEVNISEKAQEKMAFEANQEKLKTQPAPSADQGQQSVAKAYEASRIVNIVA
jgi:hypothetical protein